MTGLAVVKYNEGGKYRVVSTKPMPGTRWISVLTEADCCVEVCTEPKTILSVEDIQQLIGTCCHGVIGQEGKGINLHIRLYSFYYGGPRQDTIVSAVAELVFGFGSQYDDQSALTEEWGETLFSTLKNAKGFAFSNMAVGYNNIDVEAATRHGIAVGNTPGVLTETTAELTAALTLAAARRVVEADSFMRAGKYDGWLPTLFVGNLLKGQTVGIIGAGRIGSAYARMMVEGFKMNVIYYDLYQSKHLENFVTAYGEFLQSQGETPVWWKRAQSPEELLKESDMVSLHPVLDETTFHLINKERLSIMKPEAVLVNASRGAVVDEDALVQHLKANPMFRAGLDVFEDEPRMRPGLKDLPNVVVVPHIASASKWTREGMATLAAMNVAGRIKDYPVWKNSNDMAPFLDEKNSNPPRASPSIVNAKTLGLVIEDLQQTSKL